MKRTVFVLLLVVGLQGCFKNEPSASDAQAAIAAGFAECPRISVENVKIVNGLKIDDTTHQVKVTYDVHVNPLSSTEIENVKKSHDAYVSEALAKAHQQQAMDSQFTALVSKQQSLQELIGRDGGGPIGSETFNAAWEQRGGKEIDAQMQALTDASKAARDKPIEAKDMTLRLAWSPTDKARACIVKAGIRDDGSTHHTDAIDDMITQGAVNSYEATFAMVKTDNGWQAAE